MHVADFVVKEPAGAVEILPAVPAEFGACIEARCAQIAAEPDRTGFFLRENLQPFDRPALQLLPRLAACLGTHFRRNLRSIGRIMGGDFLSLGKAATAGCHQIANPQ